MMRLNYAGGELLTGEAIADVVLRYAAALARAGTSTTVGVPGRTADGVDGIFQVLLGPASQLLGEPTDDEEEIIDEAFVATLEAELQKLERPRQALPVEDIPRQSTLDDF